MSLRSKYILSTTCILFIIIGAFSYKNLSLQETEIYESEKKRVILISEVIKNSLITIMLYGHWKEFQELLETIVSDDIQKAWIFKPDGTIISSSVPDQIGKRISNEHIARFRTQQKTEVFSHEENGRIVYSIITPIHNERACQRCHNAKDSVIGILDVEVSMGKTFQMINTSRKRTLLFSIITLAVTAISLSILTTFLINKPIASIITAMKKAEEGDFTAKFITQRKDEIGKLAFSLNSMLSELDKARREIEKCHLDEMQSIERMATIGELAAVIAHEIKNPLAGISGAIQVLAEDFSHDDPRKEIITEILGEIERLDRSVKDLLIFARPPELHLISTPVQPIIERTKKLLECQAQKQGVTIQIIPGDANKDVKVDPEQMQQVFLNIMLNALQSMPLGGKLTIATHYRGKDDEVEVIFSDTGHGIDEELLKHIFKPFFTTKNISAGLGLAISKNIIEKHDGKITAESHVGIGSTFHVILKARS